MKIILSKVGFRPFGIQILFNCEDEAIDILNFLDTSMKEIEEKDIAFPYTTRAFIGEMRSLLIEQIGHK